MINNTCMFYLYRVLYARYLFSICVVSIIYDQICGVLLLICLLARSYCRYFFHVEMPCSAFILRSRIRYIPFVIYMCVPGFLLSKHENGMSLDVAKSWSLVSGFYLDRIIKNLTGVLAAFSTRRLSIFLAIRSAFIPISWLRDSSRFGAKTSYGFVSTSTYFMCVAQSIFTFICVFRW